MIKYKKRKKSFKRTISWAGINRYRFSWTSGYGPFMSYSWILNYYIGTIKK